MFIRKPTGSRLMSSIACIALLMMLPEQLRREVHQPQDQRDDDLDHDADELDQPRHRLAELVEDPHERADRVEQVVERRACPRCRGTAR